MFASSSQWIIAAILRRSLSTLKLSCALHIVPACRKQKLFGWSWTRSETFHRGPAFCRELWKLWFHGFLPTNVLKRIARMEPSTLPHQGRQLLVPLLGLAQKSKISSADFKPASCLQHGRHDAKFGQIWSLEAVHERDLFCRWKTNETESIGVTLFVRGVALQNPVTDAGSFWMSQHIGTGSMVPLTPSKTQIIKSSQSMDSIEEMRGSHIQIHEFRVDSIQISTKDITLLSFVPAQLTACRMQPHPAKRTWGGLHHSHFCWGKDDQTWEFGGIHGTWGHGDHILQASDMAPCPKAPFSQLTMWPYPTRSQRELPGDWSRLINSWQISWSVQYGHCWSHCCKHVYNSSCAVVGIPPASCQKNVLRTSSAVLFQLMWRFNPKLNHPQFHQTWI